MKKVALITGASGGIGLELAKLFAKDGYDLVLVARSEGKLRDLAGELKQHYGASSTIITKDLSKPGAAREVVDEIHAKSIKIEFLVNNAGYGVFGEFKNTDLEKELDMIQLNITALTELTKLLVGPMVERKSGRILNVASTAAFQPGPLMAVYYATKAYVLSFSEAIARELQGSGVTVTALCPGPTESGFQSVAKMDASKLFKGKKLPSSANVALSGYEAMMKGKTVQIAGTANWILAQSVRFAPRRAVTALVHKLQAQVQ